MMRFWHPCLFVVSAVVCHLATRFRTPKSRCLQVDNGFFNRLFTEAKISSKIEPMY